MGIKSIKYNMYNWGFGDIVSGAASPFWKASEAVAKPIMGGVNDVMGRGYDRNAAKLNEARDLYKNNLKNDPYQKYYDPKMRKYQTGALSRLYGIGTSNKLDPQAQAQLDKIRQINDQQERGNREAIMGNAQERGAASSTGTLLNELTNNQSSATNRTQQDTQVAGNQWARSLDALYKSSSLANSVNSQDLERAKAEDLFHRYNITGEAGVLEGLGTNAQNKAGEENAFWGSLVSKGIGAFAGGPAGSAMAGGGQGITGNQPIYMDMPLPGQSYGDWQK